MLLRLGSMRGLDLTVFDFDHDLTWHALFLTPEGHVLGRFGGRDADTPGKYHSLRGLRYALEQALAQYRRRPDEKRAARPRPAQRVEDFAGIRRIAPGACVHCHHVPELRREAQQQAGTWTIDRVWVYPEPQNVGLSMETDQGNRVRAVRAESAAARAGLRPGDVLRTLGGAPIASVADVQYALHKAPPRGTLSVEWEHEGQSRRGALALAAAWRITDVSWRWSLKRLAPAPGVSGDDLSADEKRALGLSARALAFRPGPFRTTAARHAGVQSSDVVVGLDGRRLNMTARQFETHVRLHYRVGDTLRLEVLRGRMSVTLSLKLTE